MYVHHSVTIEGAIAFFIWTMFLTIVAAILYCSIYLIPNPIEGPTFTSTPSLSVCLPLSPLLSSPSLSKGGGGEQVSAVWVVALRSFPARGVFQLHSLHLLCSSAQRAASLSATSDSCAGKGLQLFWREGGIWHWGGQTEDNRRLTSCREWGIHLTDLPSLASLNRAKTEGFGVFHFFFRFIFFLFLIAVLGGASSFHIVSLSFICLLIYFSIYLVYNFLYLWVRETIKGVWF